MASPIQETKERLDLVEVIASYIKLQKTGANYRALCPFHSEKKPSFFVSPTRQLWTCFGCGRRGDVFAFIQEIEGVEFGDALRILARRAGVELRREDPQVQSQRKKFYEICELATKFFEKQLHQGKNGRKAKDYLLSRGISEESIKKWRLGFAPASWNSLGDFLQKKGFSIGEIQRAGLLVQNQQGKIYDRFRARIIFPIFDLSSQVIGFGGRFFGSQQEEAQNPAKYLNIPNTLLYNKSKLLYGLDKAKVAIRKQDSCVLVEGYTDVILSHQAGLENVVATSGTALTPPQLTTLKRYSNNLITAFDMDVAGDSATKRGVDLAQSQGFDIKIAVLPPEKDPADIVSEDPKALKEMIEKSKSVLDFYFEKAFSSFDKASAEGKKKISAMLLPVLARIQNKIEQSHWVGELAKKLEVREEDVKEELNKSLQLATRAEGIGEQKVGQEQEQEQEQEKKTRQQLIEETIISLLLNFPEHLAILDDRALSYFSEETKLMIGQFKKRPQDFSVNYLKLSLTDKQKELLNELALKGEAEKAVREIDCQQEIMACLKELAQIAKKEKLEQLSREIKEAEAKKEAKRAGRLLEQFNELAKSLIK